MSDAPQRTHGRTLRQRRKPKTNNETGFVEETLEEEHCEQQQQQQAQWTAFRCCSCPETQQKATQQENNCYLCGNGVCPSCTPHIRCEGSECRRIFCLLPPCDVRSLDVLFADPLNYGKCSLCSTSAFVSSSSSCSSSSSSSSSASSSTTTTTTAAAPRPPPSSAALNDEPTDRTLNEEQDHNEAKPPPRRRLRRHRTPRVRRSFGSLFLDIDDELQQQKQDTKEAKEQNDDSTHSSPTTLELRSSNDAVLIREEGEEKKKVVQKETTCQRLEAEEEAQVNENGKEGHKQEEQEQLEHAKEEEDEDSELKDVLGLTKVPTLLVIPDDDDHTDCPQRNESNPIVSASTPSSSQTTEKKAERVQHLSSVWVTPANMYGGSPVRPLSTRIPVRPQRNALHEKVWENFFDTTKEDDERLCPICNQSKLYRGRAHGWERGHIIPNRYVNDGTKELWNLVPICSQCNSDMRETNLLEFVSWSYPNCLFSIVDRLYKLYNENYPTPSIFVWKRYGCHTEGGINDMYVYHLLGLRSYQDLHRKLTPKARESDSAESDPASPEEAVLETSYSSNDEYCRHCEGMTKEVAEMKEELAKLRAENTELRLRLEQQGKETEPKKKTTGRKRGRETTASTKKANDGGAEKENKRPNHNRTTGKPKIPRTASRKRNNNNNQEY